MLKRWRHRFNVLKSIVICLYLLCLAGCSGSTVSQKKERQAGSRSETLMVDADGQDLSHYPHMFPDGEWLTLEGTLLSRQLIIPVEVNGIKTFATLDTGAMTTTMTTERAVALGISLEQIHKGTKVKIIDAHGQEADGYQLEIDKLKLGETTFSAVTITVVSHNQDIFLLGWNVLKDFDLMLVADEGLVGLFESGTFPHIEGGRPISLLIDERQAMVKAAAPGGTKEVPFDLVVDTGASVTSVPIYIGMEGGLPADIHYSDRYLAVNSEREERGRFLLDPLYLGPERFQVPKLLATASNIAGGRSIGLLGNDVLTAYHTLINFRGQKIVFHVPPRKPPYREKGPGNQPCKKPDGSVMRCIEVSLFKRFDTGPSSLGSNSSSPLDLNIEVHHAYQSRTLELLILAYNEQGRSIFQGGGLRAFISVGKDDVQQRFKLWGELQKLGLSSSSSLELRWVRTENIRWPCDPMHVHCLSFSGPLSQSAASSPIP